MKPIFRPQLILSLFGFVSVRFAWRVEHNNKFNFNRVQRTIAQNTIIIKAVYKWNIDELNRFEMTSKQGI